MSNEDEEDKEIALDDIPKTLEKMRAKMKEAAAALEYEKAAQLRDKIRALESMHLQFG